VGAPSPQAWPAPGSRAERTRQRILAAASQSFAAAGFSKTTVEEIAAAAGVSKGIVYRHFRGKELILEALLERTLDDWMRASRIDVDLARSGRACEAIERALRGTLDHAHTNPLVRALHQLDPLVLLGLHDSAAVRRRVGEARAQTVDAMRAAIASGELRADLDAERAADLVRMVMFALVDHLLSPQWIDGSDERFVATCVDVLCRGLHAEPRG
jgi:TetR/AcrR family acrAB operon transcriptional repressor